MFSWATGSLERLSQTIAPVPSDPISRFVYCCQQNDEEGAMQLVPELGGAGVIVNSSKGYCPIHVACLNTLTNLARLLLTQPGASIEICDAEGNTGLHCAAMSAKPNALELVTMLITDIQANVTAKNNKGQTPYDVSKISSVRQYLLPLQLQKETREALDNGGHGLPPGIDLGGLQIKNSTLAPPPMIMGGGGGGMIGGGGMGTSYPQPPPPPQMGGGYVAAAESSMIPRAPNSDGMEQQQQTPPPIPPASGNSHRVSSAPASSSGYSLSGSSSAAIYKPPASARGRSFVQPDGFHSSSSDKKLQEKYGHHTSSSGNLSATAAANIPPPPSSGNAHPGSGNLPMGIGIAAAGGGSGHISAPPSFGVANNNPYAGGASHLTARRSNRYVSYDPITGKQQAPLSAPPPRAASFSYLQQQPAASAALNFNVFTPPGATGQQQQQQQQSGGAAAAMMTAPAPASAGFPTSPSQYQQQQPQYQQQQQQAFQQQQQQQGYQYHQHHQPPASPAAAAAASLSSLSPAVAAQHLMQPPPQLGGGGGSFGGGVSPLANSAAAMFGTPSPVAAATSAASATTSSPMGASFSPAHQQQQSPSHLFSTPAETSSPLAAAASALFGAPPPATAAVQQQQEQHEPAPTANAFGTPQREYQHATLGAPPQPAEQQPPTAAVSPMVVNAFPASQPNQQQHDQQQNPAVVVAAAPRSNDGMMAGFSSTLSGSITKAPSSGGMPLDFGGRAATNRSAVDAFSAPPGAAAAASPNMEVTSAAAAAAAGIQIVANSNVGGTAATAAGAFGAPPVGLVQGASFPAMPVGNPIQGGSRGSSGGAVDLFSKPSAGVSAATAFSSQAQIEQPKEEVGTTAATTTVDAVAKPVAEILEQKPTLQQAPSRSWSVDSADSAASASELFSKGPPGGTAASDAFSTTTTPAQAVNPEPDAKKEDEPVQATAAALVDVPLTEPQATVQEEEDPDQMDDIPLSPEAPKGNHKSPPAGALSANELFSAIGMPPPPFQKK